MGKSYHLLGRSLLREMIRMEDERKRNLVVGNRYGNVDGGSLPSNVVSLQEYRQQQSMRKPPFRLAPKLPV